MVKYPQNIEELAIMLIGIGLFFSLMVYGIYLISYEEGYYDAKQEDYCHEYCFDTFAMSDGIHVVDQCFNSCMEEKEYTNYWYYALEENQEGGKE